MQRIPAAVPELDEDDEGDHWAVYPGCLAATIHVGNADQPFSLPTHAAFRYQPDRFCIAIKRIYYHTRFELVPVDRRVEKPKLISILSPTVLQPNDREVMQSIIDFPYTPMLSNVILPVHVRWFELNGALRDHRQLEFYLDIKEDDEDDDEGKEQDFSLGHGGQSQGRGESNLVIANIPTD